MKTLTEQDFRNLVGNKFFSVKFIKKNGDVRDLNGRLGVVCKLRGGVDSTAHLAKYVNVYEGRADTFYRKVNLETVQHIKINGETHLFN